MGDLRGSYRWGSQSGVCDKEQSRKNLAFLFLHCFKKLELAFQSLGPLPCGFDPWVGKIPWRRARQPTPVFFPVESPRQRSPVGCNPCGIKESGLTAHTWARPSLVYCPVTFLKCKKLQGWLHREGKDQVPDAICMVSGSDMLALWSINTGMTEWLTLLLSDIHFIYILHTFILVSLQGSPACHLLSMNHVV